MILKKIQKKKENDYLTTVSLKTEKTEFSEHQKAVYVYIWSTYKPRLKHGDGLRRMS